MKVTDDSKQLRSYEPERFLPKRYYITRNFKTVSAVPESLYSAIKKHGGYSIGFYPLLDQNDNSFLTFQTDKPEQAANILNAVTQRYRKFVTIRRCIIGVSSEGKHVIRDLGHSNIPEDLQFEAPTSPATPFSPPNPTSDRGTEFQGA